MAIRWKNSKEREAARQQFVKINSWFYSFLGGILGAIGVWFISCIVVYWYPNMFAVTDEWLRTDDAARKDFQEGLIVDVSYHIWENGLETLLVGGVLLAAILGILLPFWKRLEIGKIIVNRIPFEAIVVIALVWISTGVFDLKWGVAEFYRQKCRYPLEEQYPFFFHTSESGIVTIGWLIQIAAVFVLLYGVYAIVVSLRQIITIGPVRYIQRRTIVGFCLYQIVVFFRSIGRSIRKMYTDLREIDLQDAHSWAITKIVIANFIVLSVIAMFWWMAIPILVIYSLVIFYLIQMYVKHVQDCYDVVVDQVTSMNRGNLTIEGTLEDAGPFSRLQQELVKLQGQVSLAIEEKLKSQKMKTELITNVSHDLKTPLTAIITYVNLLKEEGISEEEREGYIATLEQKSMRLKGLIEDLFEASKAASGNVELQMTKVNLSELICQVYYEMADLLEASGVELRIHLPEKKIILNLDSQKTYRIFANLIGNIAKYALRGTRGFIDFTEQGGFVTVTIKNVSALDLDGMTPQSLTERFVRGDASRATEGSGLGLAIAKSFAELQDGRLELEIDGDLFKAMVSFPQIKEEGEEE